MRLFLLKFNKRETNINWIENRIEKHSKIISRESRWEFLWKKWKLFSITSGKGFFFVSTWNSTEESSWKHSSTCMRLKVYVLVGKKLKRNFLWFSLAWQSKTIQWTKISFSETFMWWNLCWTKRILWIFQEIKEFVGWKKGHTQEIRDVENENSVAFAGDTFWKQNSIISQYSISVFSEVKWGNRWFMPKRLSNRSQFEAYDQNS